MVAQGFSGLLLAAIFICFGLVVVVGYVYVRTLLTIKQEREQLKEHIAKRRQHMDKRFDDYT